MNKKQEEEKANIGGRRDKLGQEPFEAWPVVWDLLLFCLRDKRMEVQCMVRRMSWGVNSIGFSYFRCMGCRVHICCWNFVLGVSHLAVQHVM